MRCSAHISSASSSSTEAQHVDERLHQRAPGLLAERRPPPRHAIPDRAAAGRPARRTAPRRRIHPPPRRGTAATAGLPGAPAPHSVSAAFSPSSWPSLSASRSRPTKLFCSWARLIGILSTSFRFAGTRPPSVEHFLRDRPGGAHRRSEEHALHRQRCDRSGSRGRDRLRRARPLPPAAESMDEYVATYVVLTMRHASPTLRSLRSLGSDGGGMAPFRA